MIDSWAEGLAKIDRLRDESRRRGLSAARGGVSGGVSGGGVTAGGRRFPAAAVELPYCRRAAAVAMAGGAA